LESLQKGTAVDADQAIVVTATRKNVRAFARDQRIIASTTAQRVIAIPAIQVVIAQAAINGVIAAKAQNGVIAGIIRAVGPQIVVVI
jgi:hypothetical protein